MDLFDQIRNLIIGHPNGIGFKTRNTRQSLLCEDILYILVSELYKDIIQPEEKGALPKV